MPTKTPPPAATSSPSGTTVPPADQIMIVGIGHLTLGSDVDEDGNKAILLTGANPEAEVGRAISLKWEGGVLTATMADGSERTGTLAFA